MDKVQEIIGRLNDRERKLKRQQQDHEDMVYLIQRIRQMEAVCINVEAQMTGVIKDI